MAAKRRPKLSSDALDFVVAEDCPQVVDDPCRLLVDGVKSRAPIVLALERKSDYSFFDSLAAKLVDEGVDEKFAPTYAFLVLTEPSLALSTQDGPTRRIVQGLTVSRTASDENDIRLLAEAQITNSKPPEVSNCSITVFAIDSSEDDDCLELVKEVEELLRAFPSPNTPQQTLNVGVAWAWFGNPHHLGYLNVPQDWQSRVASMARALGAKIYIASSEVEFNAQNLGHRAAHAVSPMGAGIDQVLQRVDGQVVDTFEVGTPGTSFEALLDSARRQIYLLATAEEVARSVDRDLKVDEIVYHRKISNGRKFDYFDEGSQEPCKHGSEGFVPWNGDKARKGMRRRYTNFSDKMLMHCGRFPDCGMYAVSQTRG